MIKFRIVLVCLCLLATVDNTIAQENSIALKKSWEYLKGDIGGIFEAIRPVKKGSPQAVPLWEEVELPHCFNALDAVNPDVNYYQGPGWYKKDIDIKETDGEILLHFEGAGQKTEVYIHQNKVGLHVGGYDEWTLNITEAVKLFKQGKYKDDFKGKVPLVIRCDNSRDLEMIPSDLSDFNIYGGLYRAVNLLYKAKNYIENVETITSVNLKANNAYFSVKANFIVKSKQKTGQIHIKLFSPNGKLVIDEEATVEDLSKIYISEPKKIKKPQLWSPSNPNLYRCEVTLITSAGVDVFKQQIGFKDFKFIKKGPFELNGKRLLLRGTHRHEDHAGKAAAMTKAEMKKEMMMMKDMGVNFIRLGHYQQSSYILDLCDRLGIMVWEEIPWCRGGLGGEVYKQQARRMLKNMITQHRNHPSVIIWGLGNENDWPGDFTEFDKEKIREFMSELNDLAHELDPSRKTAIRRCDFCKDIVDVYSPSIWAGWYRGKFVDYKQVSQEEMKDVNHFIHVEWGASNHARRHSENPDKGILNITNGQAADERDGDASLYGGSARVSKDGDWTETYACNLIDWHLKEQENMPWLTGTAYWPFKDFSTPVRPENPVPYVNQKGVVERDFTKKEGYYVFQSYWTEKPMTHIYGHTWPTRWGEKDEKKLIKVYSNCPEVELIVNGKSLGTKKRNSQDYPAAGLRWEVVLTEGANSIKAIGKKFKRAVVDEVIVDYQIKKWSEPAELILSIDHFSKDTTWLEVQAIDINGVKCLNAKNSVVFDATGDGKLIINQGTSRGSKKLQLYNGRALIGLLQKEGKSSVSVRSNGLKTGFKTVKTKLNAFAKKKDIFLLIGQSNMAGRAPFTNSHNAIEGVQLYTKKGYWTDVSGALNSESTIRKKITMQQVGPGYSFANKIAAYFPSKQLGLVVNAKGGSSIADWKKDGLLFNQTIKRIQAAQKEGNLKAVLWHQGESDLTNKAYLQHLSEFINAVRKQLELPDLTFVLGGLLESKTNNSKDFNVNLKTFADKTHHVYYVSSAGLKAFDNVHFDASSQKELGERYSEIVKNNIYNNVVINDFNAENVLVKLANRYKKLLATTKIDSLHMPRSIEENGALIGVRSKDWTSGFFPGVLWYLYEYSNFPELKSAAMEMTSYVEKEQYNGTTHDMGFKIGCSVGNGYRITNNTHYKAVLIKSAETLITRFNPVVGCIRSWDHNSNKWDYPVIIDNMMNLELLFETYKLTGDKKFYDTAVSHADVTLKNHFREDNSSYHVIGYDPDTGKALKKNTHQGYSHESIWARGQAWGLYGYTLMYRETKDVTYLEQANKIAALIFQHKNMPKDLIPYWDYSAPNLPFQPRDVSAAAVIASALLELKEYVHDDTLKKAYRNNAKRILANLSSELYTEKTSKYFILNQSTGSLPHNSEVNVPLVYADYYFVEALLRWNNSN